MAAHLNAGKMILGKMGWSGARPITALPICLQGQAPGLAGRAGGWAFLLLGIISLSIGLANFACASEPRSFDSKLPFGSAPRKAAGELCAGQAQGHAVGHQVCRDCAHLWHHHCAGEAVLSCAKGACTTEW